jgi:hypothetical protein
MTKLNFRELEPRILPDMSAKVAFLSQEVPEEQRAARPAVSAAAIVERDGRSVVFMVRADKLRAVVVQTGRKFGELVEVNQGLQPGDKVVLAPAAGWGWHGRTTGREVTGG